MYIYICFMYITLILLFKKTKNKTGSNLGLVSPLFPLFCLIFPTSPSPLSASLSQLPSSFLPYTTDHSSFGLTPPLTWIFSFSFRGCRPAGSYLLFPLSIFGFWLQKRFIFRSFKLIFAPLINMGFRS